MKHHIRLNIQPMEESCSFKLAAGSLQGFNPIKFFWPNNVTVFRGPWTSGVPRPSSLTGAHPPSPWESHSLDSAQQRELMSFCKHCMWQGDKKKIENHEWQRCKFKGVGTALLMGAYDVMAMMLNIKSFVLSLVKALKQADWARRADSLNSTLIARPTACGCQVAKRKQEKKEKEHFILWNTELADPRLNKNIHKNNFNLCKHLSTCSSLLPGHHRQQAWLKKAHLPCVNINIVSKKTLFQII